MGLKRLKRRLKNKKILINVILSSISAFLFILIIFFTLTVFTKKYRDIAASFGINIDDNCNIRQGVLNCGYIKLSGKDFNVHLQNVQGIINFKGLLNTEPVLDIAVDRIDAVYINDLKAPPSKKIHGIFESYLFLNYAKIFVKSVNLKIANIEENIDLVTDIKDIKNEKNSLYASYFKLKLLKEDKDYYVSVVNPQKSLIIINPSWINIQNMTFSHENIYLTVDKANIYENKKFELEGSSAVKNFAYEDIYANTIDSSFKIKFQPDKFIDIQSKGKIDKVTLSDKETIKDIDFNFSLNGRNISDFKMKGNIKADDSFFHNKKTGKLELNYKLTKKDKSLFIDGDLSTEITDIKLSLKDNLLNLKTQKVSLAKLKNLFDVPEELKSVEGEFSVNINIDTSTWNIYADLNLEKAQYSQLKNISGKINARYLKDSDTLNLVSSLSEKSTVFYLKGEILNLTKSPYLNLDLNITNFSLENIPELQNLKIAGNSNLKGKIAGNIDSLKVNLDGHATSFRFEEILLKDLDYKFRLEGKNINIDANLTDRTLFANINIDLHKDQTEIKLKADRFKAVSIKNYLQKQSDVFSKVDVFSVSGKVDILVLKDDFKLTLKLDEAIVGLPGSSRIKTAIDGFITDKDTFLKIDGYTDRFSLEGHEFEKLSLKATLKNKDIFYGFSSSYLLDKDKVNISSTGTYNIDTTNLKADLKVDGKIPIRDKTEEILLEGSVAGNLENIDGNGAIRIGKTKTSFNAKISSPVKNKLVAILNISPFSYVFDGRKLSIENVQGRFDINKENVEDFKGAVKVTSLSIFEKNTNLIWLKELVFNIAKDRLSVVSASIDGALKGKVDTFDYNFKNGLVKVLINGEIDKKYLSEISQLLNVDGNLKFSFSYSGDIKNLPSGYNLKLYGDNLRLRTPYTQNIINFRKFNINAKDELYVDIDGATKSSAGDGVLKLTGKAKPDLSNLNIDIFSSKIPVKYLNIFSGIMDGKANIKLADRSLKIDISSQITGRAKVEPELLENSKTENDRPELIKKAKLNIDISTSSPVFLEGNWGRAYAEGEVSITGTVEKPIINGKIKINYGKVALMKNIYNIDFLNIKITNNDIYVNGRLSSFVSGVNVFVNVSGSSKNLRYDFFSTPPKSKEEILTLLLLKKSPEQLASTGLFGILGKVGEMLIPFKVEEEEKGIFGTGVNVNIIPSYSPVQGIVFSVYMQKYLTRRIYIGLSRPLSQYQLTNYVGWYEGGVRLSERTSFVIKSFENKARSAEITFTLPFDF